MLKYSIQLSLETIIPLIFDRILAIVLMKGRNEQIFDTTDHF